MAVPADESPVPDDHRVMRLPVPPKDFVPNGWKPTQQELVPSNDDKRFAEERGAAGAMAVVYDHLAPSDRGRPGAAGHAGISGLERATGEARAVWRTRVQRVASTFELYGSTGAAP